MSKEKKDKKDKKDKGAPAPDYTLSAHPRAQRQIVRARAIAALAALVVFTYLGHAHGSPFPDALQRGLIGAVAAYLAVWVLAVLVWRQLAQAEIEVARRRILERAEELAAERAEADAGRVA